MRYFHQRDTGRRIRLVAIKDDEIAKDRVYARFDGDHAIGCLSTNPAAFRVPRETIRCIPNAFTLIELLTVLAIIGLISVLALPTVIPAISHRQVSEGARLLQASIAGARDRAALTGRPAGIRLMLDPAFPVHRRPDGSIDPAYPLVFNRWIPIEVPPNYSEGTAQPIPTGADGATLFPNAKHR